MAAAVSECRMLDRILESICSMAVAEEDLQYGLFQKKYANVVLAHMLTEHASGCYVGDLWVDYDRKENKAAVDVDKLRLFQSADWKKCVQNRQPLWGRISIFVKSVGAHANAFLITFPRDDTKGSLEFFEPHGEATWSSAVFKASEEHLRSLIPEILAKMDVVLPLDYCPNYSIQQISEDERCYNWSSLYLVLRLMCPRVGRAQLITQLTRLGKDGLGELMAKWTCFQWNYGRLHNLIEAVDSKGDKPLTPGEILRREQAELYALEKEVGGRSSEIDDVVAAITAAREISGEKLSSQEARPLLERIRKAKIELLKRKHLLNLNTLSVGDFESRVLAASSTKGLDLKSSAGEHEADVAPFVDNFLKDLTTRIDLVFEKWESKVLESDLLKWRDWVQSQEDATEEAFSENDKEEALVSLRHSIWRAERVQEYTDALRALTSLQDITLREERKAQRKLFEGKLNEAETDADLQDVMDAITAKQKEKKKERLQTKKAARLATLSKVLEQAEASL